MSESEQNPIAREPASPAGGLPRPSFELEIPSQAAAHDGNMLLDAKQTAAWFEALPMANVGETARQVFSTLVEFNRTELPDPLRARTVERFRGPVEYITDNLQKYYVDSGLPLSPKGAKTAALARELQKELALSYKIIVQRMIAGANSDRRLMVTALHRTLHYLGQSLLQHALTYAEWPAGIWREINGIYAYAAQQGIHEQRVRTGEGRTAKGGSTVEDVFKSLMLFASATPHRLRQSHARILHSQLMEWSRFTRILKDDDGGTSLGRFNVDLRTDSAPMHNALRMPAPGEGIAILDVRELLQKLRADFEQAPWDNRLGLQSGHPVVTRPLLRQLILAWSRPPDRRFVRTRLNFDLHVVAGLHTVYANLRADQQLPYDATRTPLFTLEEHRDARSPRRPRKIRWSPGGLENVSAASVDSDLAEDLLLAGSYLTTEHGDDPVPLLDFVEPPTAPQDEAQTARHAVQTVNESAGGYCIHWQGHNISQVKIGELLGVESPADRRRYGLGVVRWMKQRPDQGLDLGLEVISTRCEAAEVREVGERSPHDHAPAYRCLVINDTDPATNATASLIMNTMNLQTGMALLLSLAGREQRIRLTKLVEFSSAFARYQFEFVQTAEEKDQDGGRPGDQFSDLWSSL